MIQRPSVSNVHTFTGHKDSLYALAAVSDHEFVSSGADGMVIQWNLQDFSQAKMVAKVSTSVYALAYDPILDYLFIGQNFDGLHVIELSIKRQVKSIQLTKSHIFDIKFDNEFIYLATGEGTVHVINRTTWLTVSVLNFSEKSARTLIVDDLQIYVGYSDGFVRIFDKIWFSMLQEFKAHDNSIFTMALHPNTDFILTGSRDAHLKIWNIAELKNIALKEDIIAHMYTINHIKFSQDGSYFLTCSMDKSIKIWNSLSMKLMRVIDKGRFAGHGTSVNKLLTMLYSNSLISCSDDRTISVWEIKFNQ